MLGGSGFRVTGIGTVTGTEVLVLPEHSMKGFANPDQQPLR